VRDITVQQVLDAAESFLGSGLKKESALTSVSEC
jgi:hypothetical protein